MCSTGYQLWTARQENTIFTLKQLAPALDGPGISRRSVVRKTPVKLAPLAQGLLSCHGLYIFGAKLPRLGRHLSELSPSGCSRQTEWIPSLSVIAIPEPKPPSWTLEGWETLLLGVGHLRPLWQQDRISPSAATLSAPRHLHVGCNTQASEPGVAQLQLRG